MLRRILISGALMVLLHFVPVTGWLRAVLYLLPYGIIGYDILWKAVKGIGNGQLLDENFLMTLATVGAFVLGILQTGEYMEAVMVMLFYQVGELFQSYAVGKSRKNIAALMDIRPDKAWMEQDGQWVEADPEEVPVGAVIRIRPGERIPLDGVVLSGSSALDTAALTGESLPRDVTAGDSCCSGCINLSGVLHLQTVREYGQSTVARILELVENAAASKSRSERFISRFARVYTPAVCIAAVLLAVLPPLLMDGQWSQWLYRALTFLVASCPCALVISIPLTFFAGIGGASKAGILIKGANYLETLSGVRTVVFDKTGTLTCGKFQVTGIFPTEMDAQALLRLAALAELSSGHPISQSLRAACEEPLDASQVQDVHEHSGFGVTANVAGHQVACGNQKLMEQLQLQFTPRGEAGTVVYVAVDGAYAGCIMLHDVLKPTSRTAIAKLKDSGVKRFVMLTGDNRAAAEMAAGELGLTDVYAGLLPDDKVDVMQSLLQSGNGLTAFVGDGINDAPVLSCADVGIAMGAMGSDAAIEAADAVIMDDDPQKVAKAIQISKKCMAIVYQNLVFAIGIKLLSLVLVALGLAGMWLAIFADVGVMVLAVLNAMRALWFHRNR